MSPDTSLQITVVLPLLGALLILVTGSRPNLREASTLITASLLFIVVLGLLPHVLQGERPQSVFAEPLPGITLALQAEPLGMLFALVASLLWIVTSVYSVGYMRANGEAHQTRFYACFAVALSSTMGVAFSENLMTLFVFYEVLTLSTYPLVTHKGTEEAMKAGRVYLGILLTTSICLLLLAIAWTWQTAGTLSFVPGGILAGKLHGPALGLLLLLYVFGIGKAAMMPVHRWLPAAMVAPTPVSALLHAVAVVKAGVFAVVKIVVYVFGLQLMQTEASTHWLLYAAGFTVLVASLIALRQDNLKLRLAYSTVSQLSYVVLAVAILAPLSAAGAALHIAAHAFGKITLFFAAGSIYTAAHKTQVSQLDGIGRRMPWTMGTFAIGAMSMIGVPPAAGFLSKWYMLMGAYQSQQMAAIVVIVASTLLSAANFTPIVYAAFFNPPPAGELYDPGHGEAPWPIVIALVTTAAFTIALFIFPEIALNLAHQLIGA